MWCKRHTAGLTYHMSSARLCGLRRILRVLRIFRMRRIMQRWAEGAVTEAASKLFITLLSILLIGAGMFYEMERYGVSCNRNLGLGALRAWRVSTVLTESSLCSAGPEPTYAQQCRLHNCAQHTVVPGVCRFLLITPLWCACCVVSLNVFNSLSQMSTFSFTKPSTGHLSPSQLWAMVGVGSRQDNHAVSIPIELDRIITSSTCLQCMYGLQRMTE